ncbi:hypothetical protein [Leifsonia sp. TF02-11]|uniref:hypothetical protein n=1 Tax=Leifsonia sp. TF02-11 TaxID=2815212 RepID=UPI001AA1D313|nr:hypothetical protein [Leifsonia sp. TF02-11]
MTSNIQPLPEDLRREPFTTHDALKSGLSARQLRSHELVRPIRGIRVAREADGLLARCRAYATHRRTDFAFSHTTAAAFYGIPLPHIDPLIHVTVRAPGRAPAIAGFAGHKLARWETWLIHDLPVTTPEQTWIDLAQNVQQDAVAAGDFLVSGRLRYRAEYRLRACWSFRRADGASTAPEKLWISFAKGRSRRVRPV